MKNLKKLCLVALSTIALFACGDEMSANAPESTAPSAISATSTSDDTATSAPGMSSESSATPDSSVSPSLSSTPAESSGSSADTTSEAPVEKPEAQIRHETYLAASESGEVATIRGKIMGFDKYSGSSNCNIYLQEGVYGYWVNNFPYAEDIVGKSYEITAPGAKKAYPALNANSNQNPVITELTGNDAVEAAPLALGAEDNNYETSRNAKIEVANIVVKAVDDGKKKFTFDYNGTEYIAECNASSENAAPIADEIATLAVGQNVQKIAGSWYGETTIHITDIADLKVEHPAATGITVTAVDDITSITAGYTTQLIAAIEPEQAYQNVTWTTSDETIATVSEAGLVRGVSKGSAVITATAKTDANIKATITIEVTEATGEVVTGQPWAYTFASKTFTEIGMKELDGLQWTVAGDGGYFGFDNNATAKGQQFGSGSKPFKSMTLSTSDYAGGIQKIVVNTSGASSIAATLTVKVGDTQIGETIALTTTATDYTFSSETLLTGTISFEYTQTSSKAIYIKSIAIN